MVGTARTVLKCCSRRKNHSIVEGAADVSPTGLYNFTQTSTTARRQIECQEEGMSMKASLPPVSRVEKGLVHCLICTRNVEADVLSGGRQTRVKPGQKCPRCSSSLDAGYVMRFDRAA
jgi:DNA-directed RNA polymerase subunit RPC12/RpoP